MVTNSQSMVWKSVGGLNVPDTRLFYRQKYIKGPNLSAFYCTGTEILTMNGVSLNTDNLFTPITLFKGVELADLLELIDDKVFLLY